MTNRINALSVALEENIREDDVQPLIDAIRQMRGVLHVQPNVADMTAWTAEMRVKTDLFRKVSEAFYPTTKPLE